MVIGRLNAFLSNNIVLFNRYFVSDFYLNKALDVELIIRLLINSSEVIKPIVVLVNSFLFFFKGTKGLLKFIRTPKDGNRIKVNDLL